jgi:hypothetical protein
MANRFWVGNTGTWNLTATTNWAASSGGSSGASAPTGNDEVFFDVNSIATTCTVSVLTATCANIWIGGFNRPVTFNLGTRYTNTLTIYGTISVSTTMTNVNYSSTSPGWSAVTYNAFTTTDFIRIGSTVTSMSAIPTAISVKTIGFANIASTPLYPGFDNDRLVLAATNMGEPPGLNTAVLSSRLPLSATNIGEPPGLNTRVLSTSLAFIPNNFSILPDIPIRAIEKFGINYSQTLNPIPYQFWG